MILDGVRFERAQSLEQACARVASMVQNNEPFHVLAGGTDLVVESHLSPAMERPGRTILDVSSLRELSTIEDRGDRIRLGGGVTYLQLRVLERIPLLGRMARDVGAIQIQARGTLAGNIATASPAADGVCGLFPLDAIVGLRSSAGERSIPLTEYFTGYKKTQRRPDELIAWVDVRVPHKDAKWLWRKVGTRLAQSISKVALAAVVEIDRGAIQYARFGMASVAPVTVALPSVRALLEGKPTKVDAAALDAAVDKDVAPIDDVRSTGEYRRHVARAVVREFVRQLG